MVTIGMCSKHPKPICGLRVRIREVEGKPRWPHTGEEGVIYSVNGHFVSPHDGLEPMSCVHVDAMSSFAVKFADEQIWSGYPLAALIFLETTN